MAYYRHTSFPGDSIVHAYWDVQLPEVIATDFPSLSLEQNYGAITFYLANRAELDKYLESQAAKWEELRKKSEANNSPLLARIRQSRQQMAGGTI